MCLLKEHHNFQLYRVAIFPTLPGSTATQVIIDFIRDNPEVARLMIACVTSLSSLKA